MVWTNRYFLLSGLVSSAHHRQFSISTLQIPDPWTLWEAKECITIEKNWFFPLLYYFFADHVTQGNSDEGFFHAIYMLKYKGKRNYSLESLQDVGVAIFLNPQLESLSCNSNWAAQGEQEAYFNHLSQGDVCHFAGQIYLKCEIFLNLKTSIFPLKGKLLKIPLKNLSWYLCFTSHEWIWHTYWDATLRRITVQVIQNSIWFDVFSNYNL